MPQMRGVLLVVASALAMACGSRDAGTTTSDAEPLEPSVVETKPPVESAATPAADVVAPEVHAMPVLDLHPVVRSRSPLRMFTTTDGSLFAVANVEAIRIPDTGPIVREPRWLAGLADPGELRGVRWTTTALGGRVPDGLFMVVETQSERAGERADVYRFGGAAWKRQPNAQRGLAWMYREFSPWREDGTLALREWRLADSSAADELSEAKWSAIQAAIAKATPRTFEVLGAKAASPPRFGEVTMLAFASLSTGDVVAVAGGNSLHWTPGTTEPRRLAIGGMLPSAPRLQMLAADDVWMYDAHGLRHFDGTAWSEVATPKELAVVGFARIGTTDWLVHGERWAWDADANALYQRVDGGDWQQQALPAIPFPADAGRQFRDWATYEVRETDAGEGRVRQPLVAMDVHVHAGEPWITARGPAWDLDTNQYRWALLHPKDRGEPLEIPDPETMRRELIDRRPDVPFTGKKACEVFVPIVVDDVAGEHEDLQSELAGVALPTGGRMALLEVVRAGAPAIGLAVSVDPGNAPRVAKEIVTAVREAIGPRAGKPVCRLSIPTRVLGEWSEG